MAKNSRKFAGPVMDIGISEDDRAAIAGGLSRLLADSATLYLMTHNFHWNVKGPMFQTLHLMFERWGTRRRAPTRPLASWRPSKSPKACRWPPR